MVQLIRRPRTTGGRIYRGPCEIEPGQDDPGFTDRTILDAALVIDYETAAGTMTSITAYDDIDLLFGEDLDATSVRAITDTRQDRDTTGVSRSCASHRPTKGVSAT